MLRLLRWFAWLAPLSAAAIFVRMVTAEGETTVVVTVVLGLVAGASAMALAISGYLTWWLGRLATYVEASAGVASLAPLAESGLQIERRLARALNSAAIALTQAEAQATTDRLTGVANRETLLSLLVTEVERANRHLRPLSVAFIDIDRFKAINDTHGHNSGDAVLRQLADIIGANLRTTDIFGRYGGEEFMLILPETGPEDAAEMAEKIRGIVMETPLRIAAGESLRATISVGIAGDTGGGLRLDRLVDDADSAMYAAKSLGRNQTYVFRSVDDEQRVRRAPITAEYREAAAAVGRWAHARAAHALAQILASEPTHRGRPSDMIATLAVGMASELGLPETEIDRIRIASLLHDLGKIAIPNDILDKPDALNEFEWQAVYEHPRIGQVVLEQATSLREAVPIVLHHHERFNGSGYPHGLSGREIPLGARIVAVADAYHAIVHDRPYSPAQTHQAALAELEAHAGDQFDPDVVRLFCKLYRDGVPADGLDEVQRLGADANNSLPGKVSSFGEAEPAPWRRQEAG